MISLNVRWTLAVSARSSGPSSSTSGSSWIRANEVGIGGGELVQLDPLGPLHQDPDRAVGDLEHPGDDAGHADPLELLGAGLLQLRIGGGDHDERPIAGEHVVDQPDRALLADRQRRQRPRVGDHVAQRQDRQRLRQRATGLQQHLVELVGGDDFDLGAGGRPEVAHDPSSARSIGTRRAVWSGSLIGSSTRSRPSSKVALARAPSTSTPSSIARRKEPVGISTC